MVAILRGAGKTSIKLELVEIFSCLSGSLSNKRLMNVISFSVVAIRFSCLPILVSGEDNFIAMEPLTGLALEVIMRT